MTTPNLTIDTCHGCGSQIIWAYSVENGLESIALDPTPDPNGTLEVVDYKRFTAIHVTRPVVKVVAGPDLFGTTHYHPHKCAEVAA